MWQKKTVYDCFIQRVFQEPAMEPSYWWLKLLCLRLYRELNRRMEGVKSWDVVSCRAAKLHEDPTSGWLDCKNKRTRVFAKWVHKQSSITMKYNETLHSIWFALCSWPPKAISADWTTLNGGDSKKSPPKHHKAGISQISQTWFITKLDPWKITIRRFPMNWNLAGFQGAGLGNQCRYGCNLCALDSAPANCQSCSRLLQIPTRGYCVGRRTLQV